MTTSKSRPPLIPGETRAYPVLPLRDIVVFPHMIVPLFVGREKSIKALEEVMRSDTFILLATQKNASDDDPATAAIYEVGTLASVLQLLKLPDGSVKVLVEGAARAKVQSYTDRTEYYEAAAIVLSDSAGEQVEAEALVRSVINEFENYVKLNKKVSPEWWAGSNRSRTTPSSPTRWLCILPSRIRTSRASWNRSRSPGGLRKCMASWKTKS